MNVRLFIVFFQFQRFKVAKKHSFGLSRRDFKKKIQDSNLSQNLGFSFL